MADVPLLRCGPCCLERVGGRAGRRSRRLPGKEGLIFPTLPLSSPHELHDLPGGIRRSPLTLGPYKGPPWVVGTPFAAVTRQELCAVNKTVQLMGKCARTRGQGRRMGTTFQPSSFPPCQACGDFPSRSAPGSKCLSVITCVSITTCRDRMCLCRCGTKTGLLALVWLTQVCIFYCQVFKQPWPGIMRTLYGNHQQFETTYFKKFPGYYVTGDGKVVWGARGELQGPGDSN